MLIYLDGEWVSRENAKLSVFDHGVLYGDGVFEGIRAYNGTVFKLKEHLDRLYYSAQLISLIIPLTQEKLHSIVEESLEKNKLKDAYIRLLVTRGIGDLGLDPRACPSASIVVITDKLALFPRKCYSEGLEAIVAQTKRNLITAINPMIKSMNYLNNILAKIEAVEKDVPEAIMVNADGYVSECTGDNVFYIKGNTIVTPPVDAGVLVGITRQVVIDLIKKKNKYTLEESFFKPEELFRADEVFFTGTAAEVIPVSKIDHHKIGTGKPGPITESLIQDFHRYVNKETKKS